MARKTKARKPAQRLTSADIAKTVADRVLAVIESGGTEKWVKPWASMASNPHNPVTGTIYKGVNRMWLSFHSGVLATGDSRFVTFKGAGTLAAKALGVTEAEFSAGVKDGTYEPAVKKGSKSDPVFFAKRIEVKDREAEDEDAKRSLFLWKTFNVFHLATQVNEAYVPTLDVEPVSGAEQVEILEAMVATLGADVRHDADAAFYVPSTHVVHLPPRERFTSTAGYVATLTHELAHWTKGDGVKRSSEFGVLSGAFGTEGYAREEVRAEMAAAIVATTLNLAGHVEHPHDDDATDAYLLSWVNALKREPKEVLDSARDAQKIADHLLAAVPAASTTTEAEASPELVSA